MLRDYGGQGRPVILVPSLINPAHILDLSPERSLMRWLSEQGFHAWLLDWGEPTPDERDLGITGHVERLLLPLIQHFDVPPILVGYCLGGTMSIAAATTSNVAGVAAIASPWHFSSYPDDARIGMAAFWETVRHPCDHLGLVPMEMLQTLFWQIDPARTIAKYEAFATMPDEDTHLFVALEDWANSGAPLTYAAGAELFELMAARDAPGQGDWSVGGRRIDPLALSCPAAEFVSLSDQIVPAATAISLPWRQDVNAGHVGMVVGSRARAQLWEPLRDWMRALA